MDQQVTSSTFSSDPTCEICRRLLEVFSGVSKFDKFDHLDITYSEAQCRGHAEFFQFLRHRFVGNETRETCIISLTLREERSPLLDIRIRPAANANRNGQSDCSQRLLMALLHAEDVPHHPGSGRILDPSWVDLELARQWKQKCLSSHERCAVNYIKMARVEPAWLIDTFTNSIVPGSNKPYVTLSYRWGEVEGFRTRLSNIAQLQQPDSLADPEIALLIPPIVHHVMHVVREMQERYLWVDAMCIIQDDLEAFAAQLQMMGAIYGNAEFTIISADGDAKDGLIGLKGVSPPRDIEQKIFKLGDSDRVMLHRLGTGLLFQTSGTAYFERGWTFQEYHMSKRRLVFRGMELHWECRCCTWYENFRLPAKEVTYLPALLDRFERGFPDVEALDILIWSYNKRFFRYDEDALPGISGLLTVLTPLFEGGFLYGLPEMIFDAALAWGPQHPGINLERRIETNRPDDAEPRSRLPSWSWIGWRGAVMLPIFEDGLSSQRFSTATLPITRWYTSEKPHAGSRRRIQPFWFDRRTPRPDSSPRVRHEADKVVLNNGQAIYPRGFGDNSRAYIPPSPTRLDKMVLPSVSPQTAYISCETKRAWLMAFGEDIEAVETTDPGRRAKTFNKVVLKGLDKLDELGSLNLHHADDLREFPLEGVVVEVVAICRQIQRREGRPDSDSDSEDVYVVLWVEWEDGVAFRRASGRIASHSWENLPLEDVHLVLG